MADLQEYKCPCCGGAIAFDSQLQKMKCPYCDTEFEMETLKSYDSELQGDKTDEMDWETSAGSEWTEGEADGLRSYVCKSCGGEIVSDANTAATTCPFCDNPVVMMGQFSGALRPDLVIPFKLDKKAAKAGLMKHLTGKRLLPKVFRDQNHIDEIKGVYVPFWLYDTDVDAQVRYNNARAWQLLLRSHTQELADALRIPLEDLKWYGAFHNESHHPHIHVIAYTDDPKVGYLSKNGVEQMRSALGNHIFRDDLQHIFREQTGKRNELKKDWHALLEKILADMAENPNTHPEIEARLAELSLRLSRTKGKKVYGYLKRDIKDLIDEIVDLLAEDENIAKLYDVWYEKKYEALRTYTSEMPPKIPLSQNKEFKSIKNDIIREAMRMNQSGEQKHESRTDSDTTSHHGSEKKTAPHHQTNSVRVTAVTGLLKNLANTFRDKILGDDVKKLPTIDKRQRREIEEKRNAEMSMQ